MNTDDNLPKPPEGALATQDPAVLPGAFVKAGLIAGILGVGASAYARFTQPDDGAFGPSQRRALERGPIGLSSRFSLAAFTFTCPVCGHGCTVEGGWRHDRAVLYVTRHWLSLDGPTVDASFLRLASRCPLSGLFSIAKSDLPKTRKDREPRGLVDVMDALEAPELRAPWLNLAVRASRRRLALLGAESLRLETSESDLRAQLNALAAHPPSPALASEAITVARGALSQPESLLSPSPLRVHAGPLEVVDGEEQERRLVRTALYDLWEILRATLDQRAKRPSYRSRPGVDVHALYAAINDETEPLNRIVSPRTGVSVGAALESLGLDGHSTERPEGEAERRDAAYAFARAIVARGNNPPKTPGGKPRPFGFYVPQSTERYYARFVLRKGRLCLRVSHVLRGVRRVEWW